MEPPHTPPTSTDLSQSIPLAKHQAEAITWIQTQQRGLLGDEPGLGKSRVAIEAFKHLDRILVVAPSMVISGGTWNDELEKWAGERAAHFTIAPYSMLNAREKTGKSGTAPVRKLRPEFQGHWDAIIVDEAHYTKGRSTSWTWAVEQLAKNSDYVLQMTGTPMPNWAHELFTLLRVIWPDEAKGGGRFGSYWRWVVAALRHWARLAWGFFSWISRVMSRCSMASLFWVSRASTRAMASLWRGASSKSYGS